MRSKWRIAFVVVSVLWIAANVATIGCVVLPLPSSRHPVDSRKMADFKFVKKTQPSRDEVIAKLGQPDAYFDNDRIACYRINSVIRRKTLLIFFVIPTPVEKSQEFDLALIQYDETDHVKRYGLVRQPVYQSYDSAAQRWLASQEKKVDKP